MTELEKIEYAKSFIDKLANGINPLDDTAIKEEDIVNNVRLSRCFFYVSDVLRQVIENGGVSKKKNGKVPFGLTPQQLRNFPFSVTPIPISEIAKRMNGLKEDEMMKSVSHRDFTNWLLLVGMLGEQMNGEGKMVKHPTEQGKQIGISTEMRTGQRGMYSVVLYNHSAQEFIVENFEAILELKYKK